MSILFAENMKELRTKNNISRRELAERMFVTRSTIAHWENGSRLPDASKIKTEVFNRVPIFRTR